MIGNISIFVFFSKVFKTHIDHLHNRRKIFQTHHQQAEKFDILIGRYYLKETTICVNCNSYLFMYTTQFSYEYDPTYLYI